MTIRWTPLLRRLTGGELGKNAGIGLVTGRVGGGVATATPRASAREPRPEPAAEVSGTPARAIARNSRSETFIGDGVEAGSATGT